MDDHKPYTHALTMAGIIWDAVDERDITGTNGDNWVMTETYLWAPRTVIQGCSVAPTYCSYMIATKSCKLLISPIFLPDLPLLHLACLEQPFELKHGRLLNGIWVTFVPLAAKLGSHSHPKLDHRPQVVRWMPVEKRAAGSWLWIKAALAALHGGCLAGWWGLVQGHVSQEIYPPQSGWIGIVRWFMCSKLRTTTRKKVSTGWVPPNLKEGYFCWFFFFPAWLCGFCGFCGFCGCVAFVVLPCFTYLSIYLFIYLSIYLSIYPYIYIFLSNLNLNLIYSNLI